MPIKLKNYILLFIPFFLLLYSESISLGSTKVSQLWKIPLLAYLIYYLFQYRHKQSPDWSITYYWLSLKHLVNSNFIKQMFGNIQDGISFLFLPLVYNYCQNACKKESLHKFLLCVSQYFILTNIPFLFFGMKSPKEGLAYGDFKAYTGIMQNQHAMSILMGLSIIVILYNFKRQQFTSAKEKVYNVLLIALGAYAMYLGFARTGWVMCILGITILFFPKGVQVKQWIVALSITAALGIGFTVMMFTNKTFYDRVLDINARTGEQRELGSGRVDFAANAIELYASGNCFELACGKSMATLKDYEFEKTGMRIFAHNGFVTLLATDGAIGLLMEIIALLLLLRFILKRRECPTFRLAITVWGMNLMFQFVQGGHIFHYDFIYAIIYCILQLEYEEKSLPLTNHE